MTENILIYIDQKFENAGRSPQLLSANVGINSGGFDFHKANHKSGKKCLQFNPYKMLHITRLGRNSFILLCTLYLLETCTYIEKCNNFLDGLRFDLFFYCWGEIEVFSLSVYIFVYK